MAKPSFSLPVFLDNGEHPEAREKVGDCEIEVVDGDPKLVGEITFDDDHQYLATLEAEHTLATSFGFGPSSGCFLVKPQETNG